MITIEYPIASGTLTGINIQDIMENTGCRDINIILKVLETKEIINHVSQCQFTKDMQIYNIDGVYEGLNYIRILDKKYNIIKVPYKDKYSICANMIKSGYTAYKLDIDWNQLYNELQKAA
jgi:hypothetical protein